MARYVLRRVHNLWEGRGRDIVVRVSTRHISGPRRISRAADDLLVITTVRDGAGFVAPFLAHHRRLGLRHFVFLDNGSTDGTVERLCGEPGVTVLRCTLSFRDFQSSMRRYLVKRFSRDRWNVVVDIDELFDFPGSDRVPPADFLAYLDQHDFQAAVVQMLDLFPADPLVEGAHNDDWTETHRMFDLSAVRRTRYPFTDDPAFPISMHWGGIRRQVFETNNGLTKAALTRPDGQFAIFVGWHHTHGARLADVSAVLLHYPFACGFHEKVRSANERPRHGLVAQEEYRAYGRVTAAKPVLAFASETACEYAGTDQLVAEGFLHVSERYKAWLDTRGTDRTG
jgi:hypothetical protein